MDEWVSGKLEKMRCEPGPPVAYRLPVGDSEVAVNPLLGKKILLEYLGNIECLGCGRETKKSFNQGYCFPCFQSLARCDMCILKPELCHFHKGTCREPEWGERHCMIPHLVYLSKTSGLKVGITREHQKMTRWIDQGAVEAVPVARVASRYHSGLAESVYKANMPDRTNWRKMLKGEVGEEDLLSFREKMVAGWPENVEVEWPEKIEVHAFEYPVLEYPSKITSHNLEKHTRLEGTLMGVKGQYLLFDTGVINIRKYGGYKVRFRAAA